MLNVCVILQLHSRLPCYLTCLIRWIWPPDLALPTGILSSPGFRQAYYFPHNSSSFLPWPVLIGLVIIARKLTESVYKEWNFFVCDMPCANDCLHVCFVCKNSEHQCTCMPQASLFSHLHLAPSVTSYTPI